MRAIVVEAFGGPEVLVAREALAPRAPGPKEVRVAVEFAGVNFIDVYQRTGRYPMPLPYRPGQEGAGVIEQVGPGVEELRPGMRVAWSTGTGSYAEQALLPAEKLVPVPDTLSARDAAAVMLQGMTAHYLSQSTFPLRAGHTALVHAGAGGVGLLLTQLAKRSGARVLTTVSTPEKAALSKAAGATEVILYTQEDFVEAVKRLTGGEGVDVVYDSVGKATFEGGLKCLKRRGMMVLFGGSSGPVPPQDPMVLNRQGSLFLTRPGLADYVADRASLLQRASDLFRWMGEGALSVRVGGVYPLADAAEAHRALESRGTAGKLLLSVR